MGAATSLQLDIWTCRIKVLRLYILQIITSTHTPHVHYTTHIYHSHASQPNHSMQYYTHRMLKAMCAAYTCLMSTTPHILSHTIQTCTPLAHTHFTHTLHTHTLYTHLTYTTYTHTIHTHYTHTYYS